MSNPPLVTLAQRIALHIESLVPQGRARCLDIGCGDMTLVEAIQARKSRTEWRCIDVHGVPQAPELRDDARWRKYRQFDGRTIPYRRRRVRRRIAVRRAAPRARGRGAVARRGRARRAARARQGPLHARGVRAARDGAAARHHGARLRPRSLPSACPSSPRCFAPTGSSSPCCAAARPYRGHAAVTVNSAAVENCAEMRCDGEEQNRCQESGAEEVCRRRDSHDDGARGARQEASARSRLGFHRRRRRDRDDDHPQPSRARFDRVSAARAAQRRGRESRDDLPGNEAPHAGAAGADREPDRRRSRGCAARRACGAKSSAA